MAATTTTFQVGTYNSITDAFTLVLDLNDRQTFYLHASGGSGGSSGSSGLKMDQPEKVKASAFNIRTPGEYIARVQYKNRTIQASVWIRSSPASTTTLLSSVRSLLSAIEHPPYVLRIQLPGGTQYSYADVVHVTHNIPTDPHTILAGAITHVEMHFECLPFFRGDRVTLSNAVTNPGFEAPSGPAVTVFSDTFANFNAYSVQAGGALAQDTYQFPDAVDALQGAAGASSTTLSVLRYYRLDESSGTTCYDASGQGQNGTTHASPTQGVASLLTGDSDTCYTFTKASSQYVSCPVTGLPTGNAAFSYGCLFKFAANPASNAVLIAYLGAGSHNGIEVFIDTSGKLNAITTSGAASCQTAGAVSTATNHLMVLTWDGTTMALYVDNAAAVTAAPGNLAVSAPALDLASDASNFWNGQLDEAFFCSGCLTSAQVTALYNAFHVAPAATANTMLLPSGTRLMFGSPAWGAINTWQVRFRWLSSSAPTFYLHYTDANNYLAAAVTGTALTVNQVVGGTTHQVGTQALQLVNGVQYWLQVTQFPVAYNTAPAPYIQAQLFYDSGGTVGSSVASSVAAFAFNGSTALSGKPQIAASGASLGVGGNFSSVHSVALFGPGGWSCTSSQNAVTGLVSGAWDQTLANCYPSGPWTSYGAGRMDLPPGGTVDALWRLYTGGAPAGSNAIPVQTAGNVLGYSVYVKESGLASGATVAVYITEYNASGSSLRNSGNLGALTAGTLPTSWTQISGNYTTGANCAYVDIALRVVDTAVAGESANATVWWDNVQVWDQTRTGMATMGYHELRFSQSPAQLMISGIVGDVSAPVAVGIGTYSNNNTSADVITYFLATRATPDATAQLIAYAPYNTGLVLAKDANSYGGFYVQAIGVTTGVFAPEILGTNATLAGVYHAFLRGQVQLSGGSLTKTAGKMEYFVSATGVPDFLLDYLQIGAAGALSGSATWTIVDAGQINVPIAPKGLLQNPALLNLNLESILGSTDASVTGTWQANWVLLLPVDAQMCTAVLTYGSGNAPGGDNRFIYFDPQSFSPLTNDYGQLIPVPSLASQAPPPAPVTDIPSLTATGDPYIEFNPAYAFAQLTGFVTDTPGTVLPMIAEFTYSPRYLYPR